MTIIIRLSTRDPRVGRRKVGVPRWEPLLCLDGTPATPLHPRQHVGDGYVVALPLNRDTKRPIIQVTDYEPTPVKDVKPDDQAEDGNFPNE